MCSNPRKQPRQRPIKIGAISLTLSLARMSDGRDNCCRWKASKHDSFWVQPQSTGDNWSSLCLTHFGVLFLQCHGFLGCDMVPPPFYFHLVSITSLQVYIHGRIGEDRQPLSSLHWLMTRNIHQKTVGNKMWVRSSPGAHVWRGRIANKTLRFSPLPCLRIYSIILTGKR